MTPKRHLAALSVVSCALFLLIGCGTDPRPVVLGPGLVTPASSPSESSNTTEEPSASASSSPTTPGVESPSPSPSRTASQTPSPTSPTKSPALDPDAACGAVSPGSNNGPKTAPRRIRDDDAEIDAEDQRGNGRTVRVEDVQLSQSDGFVAVCLLDQHRLLGSIRIPRSNDDRAVRITLDERITRTATLLLVLYADNGDGRLDGATDHFVYDEDYEGVDDLEAEDLTYQYTG